MSGVVPNQAQLTGRVVARAPHPGVDRWDDLRIEVVDAAEVESQPNLLGESIGRQLTVAINRAELPEGDLTGWKFTGRVRLAGPDVVVAVPEGAGTGRPSLTPPAGPPADTPAPTEEPGGVPPPVGTWPAGDDGPRPEL